MGTGRLRERIVMNSHHGLTDVLSVMYTAARREARHHITQPSAVETIRDIVQQPQHEAGLKHLPEFLEIVLPSIARRK